MAVNRELKELLRADSAGFLLPVRDGLMLYSEEHDPAELARYQDFPPPPLVDGTPLWEAMIRQRVGTLATIYGGNYHLYTNSPYYQEYAGANGAHDTLGAGVSLGRFDAHGMACLHFWHARPNGHLFGEREVALMRLLYPAFKAGVEAHMQFADRRKDLFTMIDTLGQAVQACSLDGRVLHQTPALTRMLAADPGAALLREAMTEAARGIQKMLSVAGTRYEEVQTHPPILNVQSNLAHYAVRATLYGSNDGGAAQVVLVSLERCTPVPLSEAELRARFRLTRAEVGVATLIARGRSNADIAQALCISPHTARRHTERILLKLNVRSRTEVAAKLFC